MWEVINDNLLISNSLVYQHMVNIIVLHTLEDAHEPAMPLATKLAFSTPTINFQWERLRFRQSVVVTETFCYRQCVDSLYFVLMQSITSTKARCHTRSHCGQIEVTLDGMWSSVPSWAVQSHSQLSPRGNG